MRFTVYKTTNTVNGKSYIGIHRTEDPNDAYLGSGNLIGKAIKKYGRDAFEKEVLFDFDTPEEMFAKERELVNDAFRKRADTYNLAKGGKNPFRGYAPEKMAEWGRMGYRSLMGRSDLAEILRANGLDMSRINRETGRHRGRKSSFKGRSHSATTRGKMAEAGRRRTGELNSQYGTAWVCREGEAPRKIQKAELAHWLDRGWQRGRKVKP